MSDGELKSLSEQFVLQFRLRRKTFAAAESCTGGLIASSIVSVPHASHMFKGSAVCYCDAAKIKVLGIPKPLIDIHFAESAECAEAMARGAAALFDCDISAAATGFLDSNVEPKPESLAGTVFVAVAVKNMWGVISCEVAKLSLNPEAERNANREEVVKKALRMALDSLSSFAV